MQITGLTRREFLRLAGYGTLSLAVGGLMASCGLDENGATGSSKRSTATPGAVDLELNLRAEPGEINLLPGLATQVWRYQGEALSGDSAVLQSLPGSYLGPVIRVRQGQRVRVRFQNRVEEPTIVHWHGLLVPPKMDGHPQDAIQPGKEYLYEFEVRNRAGTYWFHPHPHTLTGPQVYRGLAGLFLVSDAEEAAAGLPAGEFDLPLVIQDRTFDQNNQLVYLPNGMMDRMLGFLGDQVLVNGQPDFTLSAARRPYRLRLLNGSNSRIYKLGWEDGTPLTVIGTDAGLLEQPVERAYVTLGPAERVELWVDFARWSVGQTVRLLSLPFTSPGMGGMGGMGMMGGAGSQALPNGSEFTVMNVKLGPEARETSPRPERLTTLERLTETDSVNARQPRQFRLGMGGMGGMMGRGSGMGWTINGRTFEMEEVALDEVVRLNTQEAWLYDNTGSGGGMGMMGGGMMQMAHPMHIHGVHFQVVDRQVLPAFQEAWDSIREGYVDEGWKDTVLVMPGEQVKILLRFQDFSGVYLNHCHNLEHEDLGMMRNFRIDP